MLAAMLLSLMMWLLPTEGAIVRVERKGITRVSLAKKLNPLWWFGNDFEEQLPGWYHPEWPNWRRELYWTYLRNPLQNLRAAVIGIEDKTFKVVSPSPAWTIQRNDLFPPETGWHWNICYGGDLWVPRPFVSYSGKRVVWYAGWNTFGFFGFKFNLHVPT